MYFQRIFREIPPDFGRRKIPRDLSEFVYLIKPHYDSGDYERAYDLIYRYWSKKERRHTIPSAYEVWDGVMSLALNGGIEIDIDIIYAHYGLYTVAEYKNLQDKENIKAIFSSKFLDKYKSTTNFFRSYVSGVKWDTVQTWRVGRAWEHECLLRPTIVFEEEYYSFDFYQKMIPKEMMYDTYFTDNIEDFKKSLNTESPVSGKVKSIQNSFLSNMVYHIIIHDLQFELHKAEKEYRISKGLNPVAEKWKQEQYLLDNLRLSFPKTVVIGQGSPKWLELQRFDVWFPEHGIAVEYNGLQHYEPVEFFGGKEGYLDNIRRDELKRKKCIENNVKLIEVREGYDYNQLVINIKAIVSKK